MKYISALIVVKDMNKSKHFYMDILNCKIESDFGENVAFRGGFSLQTYESYKEFIDNNDIKLHGNYSELYFEEDNLDILIDKLKYYDIQYIHNIKTHSWGQRVIRFYDPDKHIIEVGESMEFVVARFLNNNLSIEETCKITLMSTTFVNKVLSSKDAKKKGNKQQ